MTATTMPDSTPATPRYRWNRPGVLLPIVAMIVLLVVMIAPDPYTDTPQKPQLTTYSTGPSGARGLYEVLQQLGWHAERKHSAFTKALDTSAVYVILSPPIPFEEDEDSALIRMVRNGGRVIVTSLDSGWTAPFRMWASYPNRLKPDDERLFVAGDATDARHEALKRPGIFSQFPLQVVHAIPPVDDTVAVFMWQSTSQHDSATAVPLMLGRRVGRGRVVLIAAPLLLTNDVLVDGRPALAMQRALEWLAPADRRVIFDEYHQTPPLRPTGPVRVILNALTDTPAGRITLQVLAAALVLLLAIGIRAILPTPVSVIHRRSSLEHVDALARAYAQIRATRLGAQRLVRGLRRRHPMGVVGRSVSVDEAYLTAIQARYGIAMDDAKALTAALRAPVSDDEFLQAGRAVGSIEHSIHTS